MAKATVKRVANGKKNRQQIYCTTKSGNVYGLRTKVAVKQVGAMMQRIRKAGVINTTHWVKIKEGEKPQRKAAPKQPLLTRDTEGRPTQVHVRGGLLIAGGAA